MKKKYLFIILIIIVLIGIATIVISDKPLDINSEEITKLYSYLGEVDIYHCGGLNAYSKDSISASDIEAENKLCMAYYNLNQDNITSNTLKVTGTNEYDTKYCKLNELTFATADDSEVCSYEELDANSLDKAYEDLYGTKPETSDEESFYITSKKMCTKEGEKYYCGEATSYNVAIMPEADIYRLKTKAIIKNNGDIVISDYFLKISDNKCYLTTTSEEESSKCTSKLKEIGDFSQLSEEKQIEFVRDYGALYKHTFKESKTGHYYLKSERK